MEQSYVSPEVLFGKPYNGIISDIFNFGQMLFNIVTRMLGFTEAKKNDLYYKYIMIKQFDKYWKSIHLSNLNLTQNFKELYIKMAFI